MALNVQAGPEQRLTLARRLLGLHWVLLLLVVAITGAGLAMLYSAANGDVDPWASRQAMRFAMCLVLAVAIALIDIRVLLRMAYLIYFATFVLLVAVEVMGSIGMGAQRWIDLQIIRLQPSELMKIALVLAVARYFHGCSDEDLGKVRRMIVPVLLVMAPVGLVLKQPDLGTAAMLAIGALALFFVAGVRLWMFGVIALATAAGGPIAWNFLHDYQRQRILTFLEPESDPLGAGYHILQSQIALGSGGLTGRGFLQGSQSHLSFLPEKHTDFIFTMLGEEFGLVGGVAMLGLFLFVLLLCAGVAMRARNQFGRLIAIGVSIVLFLYVFINIAMVMGLVPVVGVPLPLISYGGTAMLTIMIGIGLVLNVHVNRHVRLGRRAARGEED